MTTDFAATTLPEPILTPLIIVQPAPIQLVEASELSRREHLSVQPRWDHRPRPAQRRRADGRQLVLGREAPDEEAVHIIFDLLHFSFKYLMFFPLWI